jgi:hypothetical protein
VVAVVEDLVDDLTEAEGHQGQIVAAQPQRRGADDDAGEAAQQGGRDQHHPHRDVDAGEVVDPGELRAEEADVLSVEEPGHEPAGGVAADGPERHETQVEQTGVADHDVQTERGHRVDERLVDRQQR